VKIVSIPTIPKSEGSSLLAITIENKRPNVCCINELIPLHIIPFIVLSFRSDIIIYVKVFGLTNPQINLEI
jgi:hypothetical protein